MRLGCRQRSVSPAPGAVRGRPTRQFCVYSGSGMKVVCTLGNCKTLAKTGVGGSGDKLLEGGGGQAATGLAAGLTWIESWYLQRA